MRLFNFFIKSDRKYLESMHVADFLGIKQVPVQVSISLAINFKGNGITEITKQAFDLHFGNLLFSQSCPADALYLGSHSLCSNAISTFFNLICYTIKIFELLFFFPKSWESLCLRSVKEPKLNSDVLISCLIVEELLLE